MAALDQNVSRTSYGSNIPPGTWKAAKGVVFYQGAIVLVKADGFAYPAVAYATASAGFVIGVATYYLDTSADAADGDHDVVFTPGTLGEFVNSGSTIAEDDRGKTCYAANTNDVALTDTGGTLTAAGRIYDLADDGSSVIVQFEVIR